MATDKCSNCKYKKTDGLMDKCSIDNTYLFSKQGVCSDYTNKESSCLVKFFGYIFNYYNKRRNN